LYQTNEIAIDEQIELCRSGDRKAYFLVYQRYVRPMFNSSMRILNNQADAEDMVQEAFIAAFRNMGGYTYKSSFEGWLRRIVINKSIDLLRRRKINYVEIDTKILSENDSIDEIDEEEFNCSVSAVRDAIKQLPATYKMVFTLFAIDEIPQLEIGKMLGISHTHVRIIYHRARKKIIDILKQSGHE
jgi:RNA polymerase sigma factor (sigma-70 family)